MTKPRVGFVTAVQIGAACIEEIYASGGHLDLIVTLGENTAPRKSGRADIQSLAETVGAPVAAVSNVNDGESLSILNAANLDWLFIVGWSQIAGRRVLEVAKHGAIGAHPTLLPIGRGRAPIPWTIINGLKRSGVTLFRLDEGVDSGPIIDQIEYDIAPGETAQTLYEKALAAHRDLMREVWPRLKQGHIDGVPQDESKATYWQRRRPSDGEILASMTASEVDALVRAVTRPYPGAFVRSDSARLRVWSGQLCEPEGSRLEITTSDGSYWATEWGMEKND